jgi:hypothetical protein
MATAAGAPSRLTRSFVLAILALGRWTVEVMQWKLVEVAPFSLDS